MNRAEIERTVRKFNETVDSLKRQRKLTKT